MKSTKQATSNISASAASSRGQEDVWFNSFDQPPSRNTRYENSNNELDYVFLHMVFFI